MSHCHGPCWRGFRSSPGGALYYSIVDQWFDTSTLALQLRTHVMKINADGTLAWAQTFEDAVLVAAPLPEMPGEETEEPAEDVPPATVLVLFGSHVLGPPEPDTRLTPSAALIATLDATTGALEHEFRLAAAPQLGCGNLMSVIGLRSDEIVAGRELIPTTTAVGEVPEFDIEVIRLDRQLANPVAYRRETEAGWNPGLVTLVDEGFLFSEFEPSNGQTRAVTLDGNLQALDPSCPSFVASTVTQDPPALQATPLEVALSPVAVTAAAANTPLTPVTLPVQQMPLVVGGCADVLTPVPPVQPAIATD